jgi:diadenosine tetraphosphatase ApaH/serine/threonine PP2A family protein phosphatase
MSDKVFCIRGNHKFEVVTKNDNFYHQVLKAYSPETGKKVYNSIIKVFDWVSFLAKIDSNILCLHVGISDLLIDSAQLKRLPRPYHFFTNKLINNILWIDPLNIIKFQDMCRGVGYCFGKAPLEKFLADNHLNLLVRAHQCASDGNYTHGGNCLTIFSASNYCESFQNKSSFLIVHSEKEREIKNFEAIKHLRRKDIAFKEIKALDKFH